MRLYAELPARRARQLAVDLAVAGWVVATLATATAAGLALWRLGDRTTALAGRAAAAAGQLRSSADSVATVPLAGDRLAGPLRSLGSTVADLGSGLTADTATLHHAGLAFGSALALLGIAAALLAWCLTRGRWIRRAGAVGDHLGEDDLEVLALAAATAPGGPRRLRRLPSGTVLAWRSGDPAARRAVAAVELRALGLRPRG